MPLHIVVHQSCFFFSTVYIANINFNAEGMERKFRTVNMIEAYGTLDTITFHAITLEKNNVETGKQVPSELENNGIVWHICAANVTEKRCN